MKIALISTDVFIYSHGVRAISAYLKKHGHQTIILSMPAPDILHESKLIRADFKTMYTNQALMEMHDLVKECDLIGISSQAATFRRVLQIIKTLKPLKKPIVWGGIFPTTFPEKCIKYADIVCIGEGEMALLELAGKIQSGDNFYDVKNFWFKKYDGQIIKNDVRNQIDPNEIPINDYDQETSFVLEKNKRFSKLKEKHLDLWMFYHGIRGCAFTCKYCCNYQLDKLYQGKGRKIRKRNIEKVIEDLVIFKQQFPKVKWNWFTDDDINLRTTEELRMFRDQYKKKINLPFRTYMAPSTVDEEKLKILIDAGLRHIELGVQTGSDKVNKEIYNRPITKEHVLRAAKIINKYKSCMTPPSYQIMITNPYETNDDILQTINLLRIIPPPFELQVFGIIFFPGSPLYFQAVRDGYIKKIEDSAFDLDYRETLKHFDVKSKNLYLNSVLYWMQDKNTRLRNGIVPKFLFNYLLKEKTINYFIKKQALILSFNKLINVKDKIIDYFKIHPLKIRHTLNYAKGLVYNLVPRPIKEPIKKTLRLGEYKTKYFLDN